MAYSITKCELSGVYSGTGTPIHTFDLLAETANFAHGELLHLQVDFQRSTGAFVNGQTFLFNPCFFAASPYAPALPDRLGWVIDIVDIAAGTFGVRFVGNGATLTYLERNYTLTVAKIATDEISVSLLFFAGQDLFQYIQGQGIVNRLFLQSSGIGQRITELTQPNVYSAGGYLEFLLVEVNPATLLPAPTSPSTDPYVRSPLNPSQKTFSQQVFGRFYDNDTLNSQAYSGTALTKNHMSAVAVNAAGITKIANFIRKPSPVLTGVTDANFAVDLERDGTEKDSLMMDVQNTIIMQLSCPIALPSKLIAHVLRVDDAALAGAQNFVQEYEVEIAEIPASNATAYPNYLNSTMLSTPASFVATGSTVDVTVQLDGRRLVLDAEYRIWLGVYNTAGRFVSSHLTPPMRANLKAPPALTIVGNNATPRNTFAGNDTVMTTLSRHRAFLSLDASTYTGVSFLNELQRISFVQDYGGQIIAQGDYNFQANSSASQPQIDLQIVGTNYVFSFVDRLPFNDTGANKNLTITWRVSLLYTERNGNLQALDYTFQQVIRVRPLNATRLVGVQFLDYTDWLANIITPIFQPCDDNPFIVVRVEKNGAPNAYIAGLTVVGGAANTTNPPTISEAESWVPSFGIPQATTPLIPTINSTFGDDFADFVVDMRLLPQNNLFNAVAAVIYDI